MDRVLKIEPKNYLAAVDISADDNDAIPMPKTAGQPVSVFKKRLLKDSSPWLVQPDYDRVLFINTILGLLWPHLSPAIHKTVMQQAKAPLEDVCKQAKVLQEIRIDRLDLGTRPPRMDCFKSYETTEDELIVEVGGGVCDAWVASPPPPTHTTTTPLVYGCSVGGEAGRPRGSCLLLMRVPGTATHPALHLVVGCAAHARPTPPPADSGLLGRRHASARDGGCEGGGAHH
jgi:hypothetical protein